ncbi:glycoside hydrolase family 18 protein [Patellaria atrata CBS 101060]|uniref:chitinase n=1 Tax=Patellaria atrata CBS 101060 TaxID=1346257 RepID=A0A9P4S864_9PEZI|nr:glycoside hydrolase family 18 protein [Patellaria atrata CBS 101060]
MAPTASNPNPPLLPVDQGPRLILYHQTHHDRNGSSISILPLVLNPTGITHVIIAAIHLNEGPGNITLNDDVPDARKFDALWGEVAWLKGTGVKVMGMLGGAAKGSFWRLSGSEEEFEAYYRPLYALIHARNLDGLDLDIEEPVPLHTCTRLLTRLRTDFGPSFILTLAPVATALLRLPANYELPPASDELPPVLVPPADTFPMSLPQLSGFSYFALEASEAGRLVSWYNTQFYCGWGEARTTQWYDAIIATGWNPNRVVMGLVTNPGNGAGFVDTPLMSQVLRSLRSKYPNFGGIMGWEHFNALDEGFANEIGADEDDKGPWRWAMRLGRVLRTEIPSNPDITFIEQLVSGLPQLPTPQTSWPPEDIQTLMDLGFDRPRVIAALNATSGAVDMAASLLFE